MNLKNPLFDYDVLHARIDARPVAAYILMAVGALLWGLLGHGTILDALTRSLTALALIVIVYLSVYRFGASRLSSVISGLLAIVLFRGLDVFQMAELATLSLVVLVVAEYFRYPTKGLAAVAGASVGLIAAGMDKKGALILVLFLSALGLRTIWHAVVERISKKQFILFIIKACIAAAVTTIVFLVANPYIHFGWAGGDLLPWMSLPWALTLILVIFIIRGLWATLLLRTVRSPLYRATRMFFVLLGIFIVLVVTFLRLWGDNIFLPRVLDNLQKAGLTAYSSEAFIFVLYASALLLTAGIDRFLFRDTVEARKMHRVLLAAVKKA